MRFFLLLVLTFPLGLFAQVPIITPGTRVPINQTYPWAPGVKGAGGSGITNYAYCNSVTNYGADPTGSADSYTAFVNAMNACTNGGYTYVPPGTYRINSVLSFSSSSKNIELRGDDPTTTILNSYATGDAAVQFYPGSVGATYVSASSGYTRGSTSVTVSSGSGFTVGSLMHIKQDFDATLAPGQNEAGQAYGPWAVVNQIAIVTNISGGNTLQFDRPLYSDFRSSLNPVVGYWAPSISWCGLRNLTINNMGGNLVNYIVKYVNFHDCWIVNCVCSNAPHAEVSFQYGLRGEIRDCILRDHTAYDSNARYGFQIAGWAHDCLAQNNICQGHNLNWTVQDGSDGNVVAYNFADICFGDPSRSNNSIGYPSHHGTFTEFNLSEGNVCPSISCDQFWGANVTNTFFRNWGTLKAYKSPDLSLLAAGGYACNMENYAWGNNIVGNILSKFTNPSGAMYGNIANSSAIDATTAPTLFLHGNFDFVSGATQWSNSISQTLPSSYYLAAKPAWFGNLQWPPIGPDINTTSSITNSPVIPAQYRWAYGTNPPISDPYILSNPTNTTVLLGNSATFYVTAGGTIPISYQWYNYSNMTAIAGATGNTYATPSTTMYDNKSQFICVVTNSMGSITSSVATLTVELVITQPQDQSVTAGGNATFTVVGAGAGPFTYQWYNTTALSPILIPGATGSSYTKANCQPSDNGTTYGVVVGVAGGSEQSRNARLTVTGGGTTTYYVATNGTSSNSGSASSPWSLSYALSSVTASNTLIFLPGTYPSIDLSDVVRHVGLTLKSQTKWAAQVVGSAGSHGIATEVGVSNVMIDGFKIGPTYISGIKFNDSFSTAQNNWIHDAAHGNPAWVTNTDDSFEGSGIEAHNKQVILVQYNLIENCGAWIGHDHGIYLNGTNCIVRNNVIRYNLAHGVQVYETAPQAASNVQIYGNLIYGNGRGVVVYSQTGCTNPVFCNTIISTNAAVESTPILVRRYAGVTATNNICIGTGYSIGSDDGTGIIEDYNLVSTSVGGAHDVVSATGGFANSAAGLYWLAASSPARGVAKASVFGPFDFFGNAQSLAQDVGFVQYSSIYAADSRTLDPSGSNPDYWLIIRKAAGTAAVKSLRVKENYSANRPVQ